MRFHILFFILLMTLTCHAADPVVSYTRFRLEIIQPRKEEGKITFTADGIGVVGPVEAVRVERNLYFQSREGNLKPDGSLVKPVPDKGYIIPPSSNP